MLDIECHCGNLRLRASALPGSLTSCNCTICRRLGALWAYYDAADVEILHAVDVENTYRWAERTMTYHRCAECGCTTHYTALEEDGTDLVAVNCRMADPAQIEAIPVREFDGLETWKYLDE